LTNKLINKLGFQQSQYDPCVLWKNGCLLVVYTDDTTITGPSGKEIDSIITEISKMFKITYEDSVNNFLGNIDRKKDGTIIMTQPKLIQEIINDLGLKENSVGKDIPALLSLILQLSLDNEPFKEDWSYHSVIGKLNYLEKSTRPDIAYAVHQCARFASNPRACHGVAVKHIGRYLMKTKEMGMICRPTIELVECYADADFAGNWNADIAGSDKATS
jgi:hypothetical protein